MRLGTAWGAMTLLLTTTDATSGVPHHQPHPKVLPDLCRSGSGITTLTLGFL